MALVPVTLVALAAALTFLGTFLWFMRYAYSSEAEFGELSFGLDYRDTFIVILSIVPLAAALSYLLMSAGLGFIQVSDRIIPFIRYFEWSITTPLLLLGLSVLVREDRTAFLLLGLDVLMIVSGFIAAVTPAPVRYIPLALSGACLIAIMRSVVLEAGEKAREGPEAVRFLYEDLQTVLVVVWSLYPLVWFISTDGFGLIGFEASFVLFTVLDLSAKIGFTVAVVKSMERLETLRDTPEK
ncbi:MAG: bacteriorhodopsin [Candidatus Nanohaloarchaea archaeon]